MSPHHCKDGRPPSLLVSKKHGRRTQASLLWIILLVSCLSIHAADAKYTLHIDHCTVAAEAFEVNISASDNTPGLEAVGTLLPQLIMEHLSRSMKRDVSDEERMQDTLWPLRQERLELFMKLDNAIRDRDGVVLLPLTSGARRRRLKAAQKTIKEAKKVLEDNLAKTDKAIEDEAKAASKARAAADALKAAEAKAGDEGHAPRIKGKDLKGLRPPLDIIIYKDDNTALWDAGVTEAYDTDDKHTSVKYAGAAVQAGIDTLITGKVTVRDGYMSAAVSVYVYPLSQQAGQASDVGVSGDMTPLANRLAEAIIPFVTNTMSAQAVFAISPEDAAQKISLSVDDSVYRGKAAAILSDGITISAGLHTLSFAAEGYHPVSATYSFTGGKRHLVEVVMQEAQEEDLFVQFKGLDDTSFDKIDRSRVPRSVTANAVTQTWLDDDLRPDMSLNDYIQQPTQSVIKIDGRAILGVVLTDGAPPAQFYVPWDMVRANATLEVKTNVFDRAAYIDKRRRWFYFSYSMLITSLIGAFYTTGRYNAMNGYEDDDTMSKWKKAKNATAIVSATCGVWAIYELVRYLRAASKVLPDEAKESDFTPLVRGRAGADGVSQGEALEEGNVTFDHSKSSDESIHLPQSADSP